METRSRVSPPGSPSTAERLDSWKEIAAYLNRSVSTVQRWERHEGLPVRRHVHGTIGSVYAYPAEVDAWWEARGPDLEGARTPDAEAGSGSPHAAPADHQRAGWRRYLSPPRGWSSWFFTLLFFAATLAVGAWLALIPPADPAAVTARATAVTARATADAAYQRGAYFMNRRQAGGCSQAEPYLRQAVALDPSLARAHAALAFCNGFDRLEGRLPAGEAARVGREEARRALALDPRLAEAHLALGLVQHRLEYDWPAAERSLRRAVEINPQDTAALAFLAELLYLGGRVDEGLATFRSAQAVGPFHLDHNTGYGFCLLNLARLDEAVAQFRRTLELDPEWHTARFWLIDTLREEDRRDESVAEYMEYARRRMTPSRVGELTGRLRETYRRDGWLAFWNAELQLAEEEARLPGSVWISPFRTRPYYLARRYARLGARDRALAALQAAYADRSYMVVFIAIDPAFRSIRGEPAFRDLTRRVGLTRD